ncbi:MAG: helix-turn-helix transcriptional regulator [Clostridia bacterium]|nr:helix-turn-helix transcriptional regulator [Clostridia bacterium]
MQMCPNLPSAVRAMPIALDPAFPIHAPYIERLHYSRQHQADHLHYHHSWEIGVCLQGSGIFFIGSRVYHYTAGDVSVIAPEVVHIAQSDPEQISGWKFLDIDLAGMLSGMPEECAELAGCTYTGVLRPEEHPLIAPLVMLILEELRYARPHSQALIRLKVAELALHLDRLKNHRGSLPALPDTLDEISPAVLYIVNHYQENLTLAQLAAMCSKSVSSFRRSFSQAMHTTPFEYLYHVRIKAAINLLQTTRLPVSDIASRVGYQSLSSFNRHFLRIAGTSPLNYRRQRESGLDSAEAALLQSPEAQGYSPAECILSASGQQSFP